MIDCKCFELPEIAEDFVQGFSRVDCCNIREGKVLQVWEMNKRSSLQKSEGSNK